MNEVTVLRSAEWNSIETDDEADSLVPYSYIVVEQLAHTL
jgi:hypothetical protein